MKKNLFLTIALLATSLLGSLIGSVANDKLQGIDDLSKDFAHENLQEFGLKSLNSEGELEYSRTFAQYAVDQEGYHYLRFATAIKGNNVSSITYTRSEVVGKDLTVYPEATIQVNSLYRCLVSGGERAYYNGTELVNEPSELTEDYLFKSTSITLRLTFYT